MSWHARLELDYTHEDSRTHLHRLHQGPMRVLQSLYPDGPGICHNVLIHPPSGLVGGDHIDIQIQLRANAHALITTPGATRFYRSSGEPCSQTVQARLQDGARLEWLPMESIAYDQCLAANTVHFCLEPGAEVIGWDVMALGLPAANLPFERGEVRQTLSLQDQWLEKATLRGDDAALMDGPLGLARQRCWGTLFFLSGTPIAAHRARDLLDKARECLNPSTHPLTGMTQPSPCVLVLRTLSDYVEPTMQLLKSQRKIWRQHLWGLDTPDLRIWST
jgi:urease accessory protein